MKLRKFITGLAVSALMVVTMATGVFAATSPSKESTSTVAGVSGLNIKNDGVDCSLPTIVTPVTTATQAQAEADSCQETRSSSSSILRRLSFLFTRTIPQSR